MVWLQLHNFPVELWDRDLLENITEPIGKLLKIDECTSSLSHTRFVRVCLEIDLAQPLKRGLWIEDGEARVFVMIVYERLPTFCFNCGLIVHGASNCNRWTENLDVDQPIKVHMEDLK